MFRKIISLLFITVLLSPLTANAADTPFEFNNPSQEQRYKDLIKEIRCLVCQNQSLEDSHAELAQDLREEIYKMVMDNRSEDEIIDFLVSRYGDFVLFRPPVSSKTLLLWFGPFVLLIFVVLFILRLKQKHGTQPASLSTEEQQRLEKLLTKDTKGERD